MTTPSEVSVLSIGAKLDSDPESNAWKAAINALGKQVVALREGVDAPLRVNVVFQVASSFLPNDFEGVRTGRFSKQDSHLLVQAAVTPEPGVDRRSVLLALLSDAIDVAESFARKRGIADDLGMIRALIQKLPDEA